MKNRIPAVSWAATSFFALAIASASAQAQLARVTATERLAQKREGAGTWKKVSRGGGVDVGDGLRTGRRSKADLKFADGSLLRLGQLSTIELRSAKGASLTGGRLLFSMLKPGRVLAGTAAAEIKGSIGIIEVSKDGDAKFSLYLGAMDVVTERATVSVRPGQAVTAFRNGTLSEVRAATQLNVESAAEGESSLLDAPSRAPFMGSRADLRARFGPERLAIDSATSLLKQSAASPFAPTLATPIATPNPTPIPTPLATPIPNPTPVPNPIPVPNPRQVPDVIPPVPAVKPDLVETTVPLVRPVPGVTSIFSGNGGRHNNERSAQKEGDYPNKGSDRTAAAKPLVPADRIRSRRVAFTQTVRALPVTALSAEFADRSLPTSNRVSSPRFAMTSRENVRLGLAAPEPVPVAPGISAEEHILQSDLNAGRSFQADATTFAIGAGGGGRIAGGRIRATATRARLSAEVAVSPTDVRFGGGGSQRRFALSDASISLRLGRGDLQVGRQRFLSGPALATIQGSMLRQGGRQIMDALTYRANLGRGNRLEVAYLNDAFVRNLPFRLSGRQRGFYSRFGVERNAGNFGLNVLNLSGVPSGRGTGVTLDFALPIVRDGIEFYGEVGRDPFRRDLRTFGLAFPGLQARTGLEIYLERAALSSQNGLLETPSELAALIYKPLRRGVFLTGGVSHFSDGRTLGTLGLAFGTRSH